MLKLRSFQTFSAADLQRIFPHGLQDGDYEARVVISLDGELVEFVHVRPMQSSDINRFLSLQAGSAPAKLPEDRFSLNAHLAIRTEAKFPGCLRFIPNVVELPKGDYVFQHSPAKRTCFSIAGIDTNRTTRGEILGLLQLSADGHQVESYEEFSKATPAAMAELWSKKAEPGRVPAIINDKYASLLYVPVPVF